MIFIVGLIMFNIVVSGLKRGNRNNMSRAWTYDDPYSFASRNITLRVDPNGKDNIVGGSLGVFLAFWSAMTTTIYSMIGFETISITAAENKDLGNTEAIKLASRKIAIRIVVLYSLAVLAVGLNVPYTDPNLRDLTINSIRSGQNSVFILSAVLNHLRGWPNLFNGFFLFSATTSGINSLYISSRVLHALASIPEVWPAWGLVEKFRAKLERTKVGVPYFAVFISWLFGSLAYLATKPYPAIVGYPLHECQDTQSMLTGFRSWAAWPQIQWSRC
jgi:amino acid permease